LKKACVDWIIAKPNDEINPAILIGYIPLQLDIQTILVDRKPKSWQYFDRTLMLEVEVQLMEAQQVNVPMLRMPEIVEMEAAA